MVYHQTPQKIGCHIIVGMNNSISSANNRFGIGENNQWVVFHQLIDSLSHNLHIAFHSTLTEDIILKFSKNLLAFEKRLHLLAGVQHVMQVFKAIFIHRFEL